MTAPRDLAVILRVCVEYFARSEMRFYTKGTFTYLSMGMLAGVVILRRVLLLFYFAPI